MCMERYDKDNAKCYNYSRGQCALSNRSDTVWNGDMLSRFKAKPNAVLMFLYPAAKTLCLRQAGSQEKGILQYGIRSKMNIL